DLTRNLCDKLMKHGHKAVLLSGEVSQEKRIKTLERFRAGQVNIMVATDVAGRGIHVDGVSHVINYTLPEDPQDYVHRIGRTGTGKIPGHQAGINPALSLPGFKQMVTPMRIMLLWLLSVTAQAADTVADPLGVTPVWAEQYLQQQHSYLLADSENDHVLSMYY